MMQKKIISASILAANFADLGQEVKAVEQAGVDYIHFDVMDHHFVPNLSFGAVVCQSLRKAKINMPIDVHLMVEHPEKYIAAFAKAGANMIVFHPETVEDVAAVVKQICAAGLAAGLAFNPDKPVNIDDELLAQLDMILLMSVYPGFGGQKFMPQVLRKVTEVRQRIDQLQLTTRLGIDGGIKADNIAEVSHAGADFFIVGSGLFHAADYADYVNCLRKNI